MSQVVSNHFFALQIYIETVETLWLANKMLDIFFIQCNDFQSIHWNFKTNQKPKLKMGHNSSLHFNLKLYFIQSNMHVELFQKNTCWFLKISMPNIGEKFMTFSFSFHYKRTFIV